MNSIQKSSSHYKFKPLQRLEFSSSEEEFKIKKEQFEESSDHEKIDSYIEKRKNDNSFTLNDIDVNSLEDGEISKFDRSFSPKNEAIFISKTRDVEIMTFKPNLKIYHIIAYNYKTSINESNHVAKKLSVNLKVVNLNFSPSIKQSKIQKISRINVKKQESYTQYVLDSPSEYDGSSQEVAKQQNSQQKSKKEQKQQKITMKNQNKGLSSKIQQSPTKKKQSQERPKQKSKSEKFPSENREKKVISLKIQNQAESIDELPFSGVLKNCKCCGKLITKLCFKCPHLYCKAQNCPRKRKKQLNEKMLQRMKQQKIEEHYRQREIYEKIKKGQKIDPQLFYQGSHKLSNSKGKDNKNSIAIHNKREDSIDDEEDFESQEEEFDSEELYDSSEEDEKQVTKTKKPTQNLRETKRIEQKVTSNKLKKDDIKQDKKIKKTRIKIESDDEFLKSLGLSDLETGVQPSLNEEKKTNDTKKTKKTKNSQKVSKLDLFLDDD